MSKFWVSGSTITTKTTELTAIFSSINTEEVEDNIVSYTIEANEINIDLADNSF